MKTYRQNSDVSGFARSRTGDFGYRISSTSECGNIAPPTAIISNPTVIVESVQTMVVEGVPSFASDFSRIDSGLPKAWPR